MAKSVYVPQAGGIIDFPDEATPQQMLSYIESKYGAKSTAAPAPEAPVGPDESGIFGRFAYGFGTGLTDIPGGIASLFYPAEEAAQTTAGQFSEEARKYLEETLGIDPTKDPTAAQQAAQALGSVASFLVPGSAAAKGASLAGKTAAAAGRIGTVTAGAQGVALGAEQRSERIRDQLASGMEISEEQQLASQRMSGFIGAAEAYPLGKFFGPITQLLSKVPLSQAPALNKIVQSRFGRVTRAGLEEGAQEAASGIANDIMEYGIYNPNVQIGQDILSNAGTGAFAGSFVEGLIQLAAGRKLRPYRQLQEDLGREAAVNAQAQRQGEISRAAEELRKVNVEGDVEVIEDDFDGISRFTIRTPGGNTVGDFLDPAEAEEAINIYKQRTDANVTVRKPADLPSVFPVKINGKEYQTTDEIIADRDSLVAKKEGLAAYMSRPDVIKREAARQNVSEALVKKATDEEIADLDKQLIKLNDFVAAAKPEPAADLAETAPDPRASWLKPGAKPAKQNAGQLNAIPYETLSWDETQKKAVRSSGQSNIIDLGGRKVVVKNVNGVNVPFYLSTGSGGKKDVPAGKWYPFFGVGPTDGWINKTGGLEMASYYGSPELAAAAAELDSTIGDIRSDNSIPKASLSGAHIDFINSGLDPTDNQTPETKTKVRNSIDRVKSLVAQQGDVVTEAPIGAVEPVSVEAPTTGAPAIAEPVEPSVAPTEPEKPRTSVGQLKEAPVRRRTLTQAEAEGPILRDYNQATIDRYASIYTALKSRLSGKVPKNAEVKLEELISTDKNLLVRGQARVEKTPNGIKSIVDLSTGILRPNMTVDEAVKELVGTLNHEIIHVLRDQGVIRPAEWNILSKAVVNTKVPGKKYTYMDKAQAIYTPYGQPITPVYTDPDAVIEEAVAEMYKDWVNNQTAPKQTRGLFNRITEFFRSIFRVLKSNKYEELFKAIDTGEVGAREGLGRDADTRLSAANMPPESNAQKTQIPGTFPTYKKASEILNKEKPDGKQLDFGAGLGMSQQLGFDTFEPYPRSGFTPTYNDSGNIQSNSYDKIVNLNVLNVVPVETRSKIVKEIGRILSPGGVAIITTRGRDVMSAKGTPGPEPMSVITSANTYQKGFTSPELVEYVSRELGEGFVVERLNLGPAGVIIRKSGDGAVETARFSAAPALNTEEFARWFRNSKVVDAEGKPLVVYHGTDKTFEAFDIEKSSYSNGFKKGFFFATNPAQANTYATRATTIKDDGDITYRSMSDRVKQRFGLKEIAPRVIPVMLSIQNPYTSSNRGLDGKNIELLKSQGYDGAVIREPNAEPIWVAFDPVQVKSIFNEFEEGAATSPRFSAAPLPTYIQSQNQNMFTSPPEMTFSEKIFNYLFGYKPLDKERMRAAVRANIVDKTAFVTLLEKKLNQRDTGNFERRVADFSATAALTQRRRASQLTASAIMMGHPSVNFANPGDILSATVRIDESPDSLMRIFEILMKDGPVDPVTGKKGNLLDTFKTYAVAIRGRDLRAQGKPVPREITPQYINEALSFIPREYPQVVEAYNMYQRFNKNLLTAARDAGLISTAELGRLTRDMNYYGFYREVFQEELVPTSSTKTAGEFKLREYKGSEAGGLINDPMFVMIRNTQFWMESIAKNLASVKSYDVAQRMGEAQLLGQGQSPDLSQGFQKDVMYFKKDGVLKRFAVKDPLLVTALGSDDRVVLGKAIDILGMPASIIRETVTRDPAFMVANLLRDTVSSWITSGEDIKPFIGTAKGMVGAIKKSASFKDLMGYGVVGSYDMAMMEPADIASTIRRRTMPKNIHTMASAEGAIGAIQSLWDRLGALSEASDAATRIAVYEAARAQGLSEAEAAMRAVEIMDFSRRGASHLLNILTKTVPFLNARIQGLDVLYQSAAAGKRFVMGQSLGERDSNLGKEFLVRGLMLAALSVALEVINDDDEDYEQLDSYIKDGHLLIPLKVFGLPGEYIAIPKPFEAGLLFSTFPQMMYKYFVSGDASNRDAAKLFFSQFASTFGVNPLPQVLIPPLEIMTNHDFYTGLPLISEGKLRLDPSLQYDSRTSTIAMMISEIPFIYDVNTGEFRGPSPIAVDQLISGYAGPVGSYIAMALGAAMSDFDAGPERMPMEISQAPVIRRFFVDAEAKNPAVVTQAYELFRVVDEANRTFSRLRQANDAEALLDYFEEKKDVLAYKKYIYKLVDRLNKISAYERQIERDKTMTDDEKIEARRNLRELRIRVASQVEEINKRLGR